MVPLSASFSYLIFFILMFRTSSNFAEEKVTKKKLGNEKFLPKIYLDKSILVDIPPEIDYEHVIPIQETFQLDMIGECRPKGACAGIDITTIPYVVNHVLSRFSRDFKLFDSRKVGKCLNGMRIVLLGDDSMAETFHDLAILLSGVGKSKYELDQYVRTATVKSSKEQELWTYDLPNKVNIE